MVVMSPKRGGLMAKTAGTGKEKKVVGAKKKPAGKGKGKTADKKKK